MDISKHFGFPVEVSWNGDGAVRATPPGRTGLDVAVPPEFRGPTGYWSPEDLLAASVASCFTVTFARVAEERGIPLHDLDVRGTAHFGDREDGRLGLIGIELNARILTEVQFIGAAERAAYTTEQSCLIARSLGCPVQLVPVVAAPDATAQAAA